MIRSAEPSRRRSPLTFIFLSVICLRFSSLVVAAPPIEAYGRLPGLEYISLSPSGERYAVVGVVGEKRTFAAVRIDGEAEYAATVGDSKVRDVHWADDDHVLLTWSGTFSSPIYLRQDYELAMVGIVDVNKRSVFTAFGRSTTAARAVMGYFGSRRVEGKLYGYFGGLAYDRMGSGEFAVSDGYRDLYRIDLDSGNTELLRNVKKKRMDWVIAPEGGIAAYAQYSNSGVWKLFDGNRYAEPVIQQPDPLGEISMTGLGRTPGTVVLYDASMQKDSIYEVTVADGKRESLFAGLKVERLLYDPDSERLIGAATQEAPFAQFFDANLQARFNGTRKAFPGYEMRLASFSRAMDRLIVMTDGNDDSGTWWLVDIASGKAEPVGYAYPEIRAKDVGPTQWFDYTAADGVPIQAVLTLPPGREAKNLPLVVLPHGGPIGVQDRIGFDWWAQAYASAGYAVLQPNYRGSGGYGEEFRDAGFRQWGRKMQSDLSDGMAALAAKGVIDPKRACIVGGSYGGYAALAGVTLQQGLYRCAVSVAGVASLPRLFAWKVERHGRSSDSTRYWRQVTGADVEGLGAISALSPITSAAQADAPVLLIHGKDDTVVPIEQSRIMESALKRAKKPVEFIEMEGEDHWLSRTKTRTEMLKASVEFVKKHNPPD
jgi:dienelactone hydrolase